MGRGVSWGLAWRFCPPPCFALMLPCLLPQTPLLQRPLANVVRALLALGWWALAMTAWTTNQDEGVKEAVQVVLKVWACVTLFMTANLLKTLLAKMMALKFNQESHLTKMYDSLKKVGMGREFGFRWCM